MPKKYVNPKGQSRERCQVAAYTLVKHFGATQKDVANVMGVSQTTISAWNKEMRYKEQINGLTKEIDNAGAYINYLSNELGYNE